MKQSIINKLENIKDRYEELEALLGTSEIISNQNKFKDLSKEYSKLEEIVSCFKKYQEQIKSKDDLLTMQADEDQEIQIMAKEELPLLNNALKETQTQLNILLLPKDESDSANVFLEIRAGTGGDEAGIFVGDLLRMYLRFAGEKNWQSEILSQAEAEKGGYKEVIAKISGNNVYKFLKFESGCHRVQRVPQTESQGRVHTSACTVAIMPEVEATKEIEINPSDLKVDTFRASGAGGQHVNKTDSAIRITHLPTNIVVECQEERSQHKNRAKAMGVLQARINLIAKEKQEKEQAKTRKSLVGTGDRSDRIRTYNYPQSRLSDHRINLTLYRLDEVLEGNLDLVVEPLLTEDRAQKLSQLNTED